MERTDVLIVGAGLLGCFAARALTAWEARVVVLERREDVCTGISRANTGIVYTGCDTRPGTLKTELCTHANAGFAELCRELDVRFRRCGSLMVAFGPRAEGVLQKKLRNGMENGVLGLELLTREALLKREPGLGSGVTLGLYAPGTGVVNPWELGIAAFESARAGGAEFRFGEEVVRLERRGGAFVAETDRGCYSARAVLNCGGLDAHRVRELLERPSVRIFPSAGDYFVLDAGTDAFLHHVIFHEPEEKGKGLTLSPTVEGNVLVGPTERPWDTDEPFATEREGLEELRALCAQVFPALPTDRMIRTFGALRPNPFRVRETGGAWEREDKSISNFTVVEEEGLISLIGIKTPGLTCASELGRYAAERITARLGCARRASGPPPRRGIVRTAELPAAEWSALVRREPAFGRIVCRCRKITEGEVLEAIRRGATTVDGVKRRTGAVTGRCQGGYCTQRILELLSRELGLPASAVTKDGAGSELLRGEGHE